MKKKFLTTLFISYLLLIVSWSLFSYFLSYADHGLFYSIIKSFFTGLGFILLYFLCVIGIKYQFKHSAKDMEEVYNEPIMPLLILSISFFGFILYSLFQ